MQTTQTTTISPAKLGDPFHAVLRQRDQDHPSIPHGCIDGWHYVGHLVIDEDGEEVEVIEQVRCHRCALAEYHERF